MQWLWMTKKSRYLVAVWLNSSSEDGLIQLWALSNQSSSYSHRPTAETYMSASGDTLLPEKSLRSCQSTDLFKAVKTRRTHHHYSGLGFGNDGSTTHYRVQKKS